MGKGSKAVPKWANSNPIFRYGYKTIRMIKNEGLSQTIFAAKYVVGRYLKLRSIKKAFYLSEQERQLQESQTFAYTPLISIIVPVYNTRLDFLQEMIDSVLAQSYKNWELCLADGSDAEHAEVGAYLLERAKADERIRYQKLEKNLGISGNTNAAIEMSNGDYIALLDNDDLLAQSALYEVVKEINQSNADFIYTDEATFNAKPSDSDSMHFKPDFSPDYLRGINYICHLSVINRVLLDKVGYYNPEFDGSQDYDMTFRVTEQASVIRHISKPLYYWRIHSTSVANDISAKPYAYDAAKRAVEAHLKRIGLKGEVVYSKAVPAMEVHYELVSHPLISIIIPTCDHIDLLQQCLDSIRECSTYDHYEIILCENNSKDPKTFAYYETLASDDRIRVVRYEGPFNFSKINNFACQYAKGEYFIFLNNDIKIISPDWMEQMLMFVQREEVGACGIKLLYPDDTIQHGGIAVGVCGSAANVCPLYPRDHEGYMSRLAIATNMSACTAACLMVKASVFQEVGGYEEALAVSFNDVDLCLKIREKGYLIVFNPVAEAYHFESRSRGYDNKGEKKARMEREKLLLQSRWPSYFLPGGDPYYNVNFGMNSISYDA